MFTCLCSACLSVSIFLCSVGSNPSHILSKCSHTWPIKLMDLSPVQDEDAKSDLKFNLMMQRLLRSLVSAALERIQWFIPSDSSAWVHCLTWDCSIKQLTIRPGGENERGYNGGTSTLPNMSTCLFKSQMAQLWSALCASPSLIVSEAGVAVFLPAGPNLLHPPSSSSYTLLPAQRGLMGRRINSTPLLRTFLVWCLRFLSFFTGHLRPVLIPQLLTCGSSFKHAVNSN